MWLAQKKVLLMACQRSNALRTAWSVGAALAVIAGCSQPNAFVRKHGIEAYHQDNHDKADQLLSQAVEQDPTDWKSLFYLGLVRLEQDRPFDAQLLLEQSLQLRYNHDETDDILDALADALDRRGRIERLEALLEDAVRKEGTSRDYMRQGRYLAKLGDIDAAKLAYRKAAFFAEDGDAQPFVVLADFYEKIGDTSNAVTALRHAHAIQPKDGQLSERLRRYGIVPGPTAAIEPSQVGNGQ